MRIQRIEKLIRQNYEPLQTLEIEDESHQHAGRQGQESHFKILVVSSQFSGVSRVQRQRQLNQLLKSEFDLGMHALSMRLLTPEEFEKQTSQFQSPNCQGKQQS